MDTKHLDIQQLRNLLGQNWTWNNDKRIGNGIKYDKNIWYKIILWSFRHNEIELANQKVREAQGLTILMKYLMPGQAKYPLRKVYNTRITLQTVQRTYYEYNII